MEIKYVIFLLVATAAQSSVAQNSTNSCVPVTDIASTLKVIQFASDLTYVVIFRVTEMIFTLMKSLLAEKAGGIHVNPEYAESRFALVRNEALAGAEVPIIPAVQAIQTFQPRIDVDGTIRQATAVVTPLINNYFHGIGLSQGKNSPEALAAIEETEKRTFAECDIYVQGVFTALLNGTVEVPHEAKPAIACAHAKAASAMRDGVSGIFDGAKILLKANFGQTEAEINSYSSQIEDAFNRTIEGFIGESVNQFAAIRNLVIAAFLKKIGIVNGLFAVQATDAFATSFESLRGSRLPIYKLK